MTEPEIIKQRLRGQHISAAWLRQPIEIVNRLGAVQAQDYAGAKWALGLRLPGATDDDVEQAFATGAILRTHVLRPTWHFVLPADIRWMLALTAPRVHAVSATVYRRCELDPQILSRSRKAMTKALRDGRQLTRDELRAALEQAGIVAKDTLRMAYLVMHAELEGLICSGARRGKQFTYALLEERAPQAKMLNRDEALSELVRRYFTSRGPASLRDFVWWSGLTVADAKRGIAAAASELEQATFDGQAYWFSPVAPAARDVSQTAYLLPNYDEYGIAYRDREAIFDAERVIQLTFSHLIVVKGRVTGTWKRTIRKDAARVEADFFIRPNKAEKLAVTAAARQYGKFLGLPAELAEG